MEKVQTKGVVTRILQVIDTLLIDFKLVWEFNSKIITDGRR